MFFGLKKPHFLGIDFGTASIKAVELTLKDGKPTLLNYGEVSLAALEDGIFPSGHSYDDEVTLYLKSFIKRLKPKSASAYVAMPAFIGLISLIEFPEMKESELEEAIQFEAHKYIPSSLDEVALSWEVVGFQEGKGGGAAKMEVLLVAALNKEVRRYENYVKGAGLGLAFLELETFSMVRSVVGGREGLYLVIDIGSRATNLVLVENGLVKVSRNLDVGGRDITRTLMEGLSITQSRAEVLKKSGKDFLNHPESALVFPALQMILGEADRMLSAYRVKYPEALFEGAILSGGTGQFTGILEYFSNKLKLPVSIGNPWDRIEYAPELESDIHSMGTSFSVALGLALSGIDALHPKKDVIKKSRSLKLKELLGQKI